MEDSFIPAWGTRNRHLQTIFASLRLRALGPNPMLAAARPVIVPAGGGVRLLGAVSDHAPGAGKGLVILVHGWEGSADSTYVVTTGRDLFRRGYDIFRLNLRDHGESHHLNEGLFHGALIEEVTEAVRVVAAAAAGRPCCLVGFSLGGNFALRVAMRQRETPVPGLTRIVAISPPPDPYKATLAIDGGPAVYRHYFLGKWKRSLRRKQELFPHRYAFDHLLKMRTVMEVTEAIMDYYPDYPSYRDYFRRYTLASRDFRHLPLPVTVIASEDDPVVPIADVHAMTENTSLDASIQRWGGHCGFLAPFPFGAWYVRRIAAMLAADTG